MFLLMTTTTKLSSLSEVRHADEWTTLERYVYTEFQSETEMMKLHVRAQRRDADGTTILQRILIAA
jgi:hypothetical protein